MSDVIPLFASLVAAARPLSTALAAHATPPVDSPWTPKLALATAGAETAAAAERDALALAQARHEAVDAGRADGLRETAELRARLTRVVAELERSCEARTAQHAEAIADAATTVIEAWTGAVDRQILFAPIVRGWLARAGGAPATARVHPGEVAAMTAAIGDAAITVEADAAIAPGDLRIRNGALDSTNVWRDRLRELRDAIATALEAEAEPETKTDADADAGADAGASPRREVTP